MIGAVFTVQNILWPQDKLLSPRPCLVWGECGPATSGLPSACKTYPTRQQALFSKACCNATKKHWETPGNPWKPLRHFWQSLEIPENPGTPMEMPVNLWDTPGKPLGDLWKTALETPLMSLETFGDRKVSAARRPRLCYWHFFLIIHFDTH